MPYKDLDGDATVPASITRPYSIQTNVDAKTREWLVIEAVNQKRTVSQIVWLMLQKAAQGDKK